MSIPRSLPSLNALSRTMFHNAHDFRVIDSQFFSANRMIIKNVSETDPVSTTLWHHVAAGAMFDSAERFPPAKCHPGTREKMIEKIADWIENPSPNQGILWLYGPAGCGKSALAHTICERYKNRCKGSFFFARGLTDRGKASKLFATLSYQLALQIPSMRTALNDALRRDPSLPTKSMEAQLFSLIIQPLRQCTPLPEHSPVLIIDGLDECADDQGMDTQSTIITLISKAIVEYNLPLRFIIASRPESWIRNTFESSPLPSITLSLSLRDDIDADKDIQAYLINGFEKIRVENKRLMGSVALPWPPTHIVERFVYEASGQYIYASTVLKFVGNSSRHSDPEEQLRILISPGPHRVLAFSELDRLYERIVSAYPRWATMKRVLGGILAGANPTIIEIMLGVGSREFILVMDTLNPLIDIESPGPLSHYEQLLEPIYGSLTTGSNRLKLCHLSFREFLQDETRSGAFHIDIREINNEIANAFLNIININIDQKYVNEPHLSLNVGLAAYQFMMSQAVTGCLRCMPVSDIDTLYQSIIATTHRLRHLELGLEMEYLGAFMADMQWLHQMSSTITSPHLSCFTQAKGFDQDQVTNLIHATLELKDVASIVRKRCIHLLASYQTFRVTPTLAYLHEFRMDWQATADKIINACHPVADVLSTFQQHRHLINVYYFWPCQRWILDCVNLNDDLFERHSAGDGNEADGWRTRGEWRHHRIRLVSGMLEAILKGEWDQSPFYSLRRFFRSRNLSDITTRKYFENPCNLSVLALITNFSALSSCLTFQTEKQGEKRDILAGLIVRVLGWYNRQLTNSATLELLESHDQDLVPNMRATMNQIFNHHFLPNYNVSYQSELSLSTSMGTNAKSIKMKVLPLPQGYDQEEILFVPVHALQSSCWRDFHDEIFGEPFRTQIGLPTIDPRHWHPCLASCLLGSLAKGLFRRNNPGFWLTMAGPLDEQTKESFAYIIECLPYAETTKQNLDSLRTIAYLFTSADLGWDPPIEFWSLSVEFLKKYDRSILSENELNWFDWWMYSMRRSMNS